MFKLELDVELFNFYITIALAITALLFICFDVHYFLRLIFTVGWGMLFQKPLKLSDTSTIFGICTTNDLDFVLKHMNNARVVRELDFARVQFYVRTGLDKIIKKAGGDVYQTASTIRYRRTVPLFTTYKITTKLIYWEENAFYLEQRFISLRDGFVRSIILSQQKTIKIGVEETVKKLLNEESPTRPVPPEELLLWINSMKISSEKLYKKD